jgi:hypothetical protein
MNKLLKEAIADAKAVRETALANAKIALEEAFTPRLQSMISARLAEEEGMDDDMDDMDDEEMPAPAEEAYENDEDGTPDPGTAIEEEDDMDMDMGMDDTSEELDLEAIIRELEGSEDGMEDEPVAEGEEDMTDEEPVSEGEDEEDIDINEIIRSLSEGDDDMEEEPVTEGEDEEETPSKDLEEAYRVIKFMQSKLNEVNLLNAKLLFSNKLFRNYELNESQKMKVIENFDRANSLREVKLVYSTICESLMVKKNKKQIKESYASKPSRSTAPKQEILSEGNQLAARWKKLANLK